MGLGIKSLQKKNGKLEQCEYKAIRNGSTGDGRAPYLEKLYILYILRCFCFVSLSFFCVFFLIFFGNSIQNSEYSLFFLSCPWQNWPSTFLNSFTRNMKSTSVPLWDPPLCTPSAQIHTYVCNYPGDISFAYSPAARCKYEILMRNSRFSLKSLLASDMEIQLI